MTLDAGLRATSASRRDADLGPAVAPPGWTARGPRIVVVVAAAAVSTWLAPLALGWVPVVLLAAASVWATGPGPVLGRLVPLLWSWCGVLSVLAWPGAFRPGLVAPWSLCLTASLPWLWRSWRPWRDRRPAASRTWLPWAAGLLPAAVLSVPFWVHRDLAGTITVLGSAWDQVHHVDVLRGTAQAGGAVLYSPDPPSLLASTLLDYPSGAHHVWAALGSTIGLADAAPETLIRWYVICGVASYALLGLTVAWVYRLIAGRLTGHAAADVVGGAVVAAGLAVAPLPGLWASGFFNYAMAVGAVIAIAGLVAAPAGRPAVTLWVATLTAAFAGSAYVLVTPVAAAGWAVIAWRTARRGRWRDVVLPAFALAAAWFPVALPYVGSLGQAARGDVAQVSAAVSLAGGLVQVPVTALLLAVVTASGGAVVSAQVRRRILRTWPVLAVAGTLAAVFTAVTLVTSHQVGYYADKTWYLCAAVLLPLGAAGAAHLMAGARQRPAILFGVGLLVVGSLGVVIDARLPRDPTGALLPAPGPSFVAGMLASQPLSWVDGNRITAATRGGVGWGGRAVVVLPSVVGDGRLDGQSREIESFWLDVLSPSHPASTRTLSVLERLAAGIDPAVCVAAVFARHHPGLGVVVVTGSTRQADAAMAALSGCAEGRAVAVEVVVADVPAAPAWLLEDAPDTVAP